jgi:hypothetical protein
MMGGCRSSAGRTFLLSIKGHLKLHSDYTILTDITKRSRSVAKAVMIVSGAMGRADNVAMPEVALRRAIQDRQRGEGG